MQALPPFNEEETLVILEVARQSLCDADVYEGIAEQLDLSDEYLFALRDKLMSHLDGVTYTPLWGYKEE